MYQCRDLWANIADKLVRLSTIGRLSSHDLHYRYLFPLFDVFSSFELTLFISFSTWLFKRAVGHMLLVYQRYLIPRITPDTA